MYIFLQAFYKGRLSVVDRSRNSLDRLGLVESSMDEVCTSKSEHRNKKLINQLRANQLIGNIPKITQNRFGFSPRSHNHPNRVDP